MARYAQKMVITLGTLVLLHLPPDATIAPAGAAVSVSLQPHPHCVEPEQHFTLTLWVDTAGSAFDGYETVIRFDGTQLTVEAVQEGSLMTGLCGNTWWWTSVGPDSVLISHVAMCGGQSINGPGALSSITFAAGTQVGDTALNFDFLEFYLAGNVVPSAAADGLVQIRGDCASSAHETTRPPADDAEILHFSACPNPFTRETGLILRLSGTADLRIEILSPDGRRIRLLREGLFGAGSTRAMWDGRDEAGRMVSSGAYVGRLTSGGRTRTRRLLLLR